MAKLADDPDRGVYLLGDDAVLHWAIAMLASLRRVEPEMRVVMLPFGGRDTELRRQCETYGVEEWRDLEALSRWDAIGGRFYPRNPIGAQLFRKLAVFEGPFEQFCFIDCDVVLRDPIGWGFEALMTGDAVALFCDEDIAEVYSDPDLSARMRRDYGARGWNTGFWFGRQAALTIADAEAAVEDALSVCTGFAPTGEQPFFNFVLDSQSKPTASLRDEARPGLPPSLLASRLSRSEVASVPMIHWAGVSRPVWSMPHARLWFSARLRARPPRLVRSLVAASVVRPIARRVLASVGRQPRG